MGGNVAYIINCLNFDSLDESGIDVGDGKLAFRDFRNLRKVERYIQDAY